MKGVKERWSSGWPDGRMDGSNEQNRGLAVRGKRRGIGVSIHCTRNQESGCMERGKERSFDAHARLCATRHAHTVAEKRPSWTRPRISFLIAETIETQA